MNLEDPKTTLITAGVTLIVGGAIITFGIMTLITTILAGIIYLYDHVI